MGLVLYVTRDVCLHDVEHCVVPVQQLSFVFFQGMPRKKTAGKYRMPQLDFVDSPPLNTPWRPTTPSRSCLCPVTADVVNIDQIGCDWVCMSYYCYCHCHCSAVQVITHSNYCRCKHCDGVRSGVRDVFVGLAVQ